MSPKDTNQYYNINFSEIYNLYFGTSYSPTNFVKDVSVTEFLIENEETGVIAAEPFNLCTTSCEHSHTGINSQIPADDIKVEVYQNIVFFKFPKNDAILTYTPTSQANGAPSVGEMK